MNRQFNIIFQLEALRDCRPPWPRQIITPILPTVKMLSLGGERLLPPPPPQKKFWIITCTTIWVCYHYYYVFFAHLLILEYPDHHQNLISSSLYYPGPCPKILSQSVHNFLSNVVHKQTNQRHQKHNLLCQGDNNNFKQEKTIFRCGYSCLLTYMTVKWQWQWPHEDEQVRVYSLKLGRLIFS